MNIRTLPRIIAVTTLLLAPCASLPAATVHSDFNDLIAGLISGQGGGTGFGGNLWGAGATTNSTTASVVSGDLTAPLSTGFGLTQSGTPLSSQDNGGGSTGGASVTRLLDTPLAGTVWFSYLFNLPASSARAGVNFNHFGISGTAGSRPRIAATTGNITINLATTEPIASSITVALGNTTHLILGKVELDVAGANDTFTMWLDPNVSGGPLSLGTPFATATADTAFGTGISSIGVVSYDNVASGGIAGIVDQFTLSNDPDGFFEVTGVPEPSVAAMAALGGVALLLMRRRVWS